MARPGFTECYPIIGCGGVGCEYCRIESHGEYMVVVNNSTAYVKTKSFFLEQHGDIREWGKRWFQVSARSVAEAAKIGKEKARE